MTKKKLIKHWLTIYYLAFDPNPSDDWFRKNASPQLVQKIYGYLSSAEKESLLETLLDKLD